MRLFEFYELGYASSQEVTLGGLRHFQNSCVRDLGQEQAGGEGGQFLRSAGNLRKPEVASVELAFLVNKLGWWWCSVV